MQFYVIPRTSGRVNQANIWGNSGWNTQYVHSERKSLRDNRNTMLLWSGCLLYLGDQIPWWQLSNNQGHGYQVQAQNDKGTAGVGVFLEEELIEKVFEVQRVSDRILLVKLIVGQRVCMPKSDLSDEVKDLFLNQLRIESARIRIPDPCRDCNGLAGRADTGFRESMVGWNMADPTLMLRVI